MNIFWHRRDLRTVDNAGLSAASRDGSVLPIYIYDPDLFKKIGARQQAFWLAGVQALKTIYQERDSDLLVRIGSPADIIPELVDEYDIETVYCNSHYRPGRRTRRQHVERELAASDAPLDARTDHVLVDPGRLDSSYTSHSQFHRDWETVPKRGPYDAPDADRLIGISDGKTIAVPDVDISLPPAGPEAAAKRFDRFCNQALFQYNDMRDDLPAAVENPTTSVSRLSPYISGGMIGIRSLWNRTQNLADSVSGRERRNAEKFPYELSWREQNYHLLYYNPDLAVENYNEFPNQMQWREDEDDFNAWTAGETGYPLVDAGMRQLNQEGYIHNRPRQVVASFLSKHLLIDWRRGARYFTKQLIDHDYASNYGNWQWIASTGTDSVDVRIFDPVSQMAKYDDGAAFVRHYVPELSDVPTEEIIEWPTLNHGKRNRLCPEYAEPIVDRNNGYERAQKRFERALGKR